MLRWRLLLGTVFIATLVGLCWLDARAVWPGTYLFPLAAALALASTHEVLRLLAARGLHPHAPTVYVGNLAIVASNAVGLVLTSPAQGSGGLGWPLGVFALAVLAVFVAEMRRFERPGETMGRLGAGVLALAYVGVLWSFVCQLRLVEGGKLGIVALVSLVAVVKAGDVGAYTFGRLLGRSKMAPVLSPGKTWAGLVGGLAGSCLGAWLTLGWWLPQWSPPPQLATGPGWWVPYGLVVGLAGVAGDLAESMLKRDAGVKDSSAWMPGFGGVLDMVDSIALAAPVAWFCWAIWLMRP